jgi:hypothetical protein
MATKFSQNLDITGVVTATSFSGDGSALTGVSGGGGSSLSVQDEGSALATAATTLNFVGAGVTASGTGATKTITIAGGGGGGGGDVVSDTTPQLGGDLDVNGKTITAASLNVAINPPAGGFLHLGLGIADDHSVRMYDMYAFPKASPNTGDVLTAGANPIELEWSAPSGGGGGSTGDISFSASTISSSGTTITLDDNVTITGTLTSSQAGAPILTSASTLTLQATTRTTIANTPIKLASFTTTARNGLTAADGDMIYNSTTNKFQGFANGTWVDLH